MKNADTAQGLLQQAIPSTNTARLPQVVAHRGYKRLFPENSLLAFRQALGPAGHHCEAIETDVHVSADGVVVLSHDPSIMRCFGEVGKVVEWPYYEKNAAPGTRALSQLRTTAAPHVPMPTLDDALTMLEEEAFRDKWMLLDIKLSNEESVLFKIAAVMAAHGGLEKWQNRIIIGLWHHKFLPYSQRHLPGFAITHIGLHASYASRAFLHQKTVTSFNMQLYALACPAGEQFVRDAHALGKKVFVWTANDVDWITYCQHHLKLDALLTDDPALCCALVDNHAAGQRSAVFDTQAFWTRRRRWRAFFWRNVLYIIMLLRVYWFYREKKPNAKTS
jgi:phosphatidylglycerol phospholipase C